MPELPEVETVRRGLAPAMEGARFDDVVAHRGDLRWPLPKDFATRLEGPDGHGPRPARQISAGRSVVRRRAADASRHVGLVPRRSGERRTGTPGDVLTTSARTTGAHDHVVFHMSSGATVALQRSAPLRLHEARAAREARRASRCCARSGPSRSATHSTPRCWRRPARGKKTSSRRRCSTSASSRASATSMSARRCTARGFRRGAWRRPSPTRTGAPNERAGALVDAIKAVLNDAIKAGGSSLRDHRRTDGALGDFQHNFRVYDREGEPCPTRGCRGTIRRIVQTGRSTFFCPVCQKNDSAPRLPCSRATRHPGDGGLSRGSGGAGSGPGLRPAHDNAPNAERSMSYQNILVETKGRVGIIRFNRPQALNALNAALVDELNAAIDAFEADADIGCILITGSEKAFAAGADIKEMADKSYIDVYLGNFAANQDRDRARAQADGRGGRGLRARRRLRARDAVRPHHRRRQRQVRPARDQARRHSRHRRHPAAHPRGRQGQGDGPDPHRPHDGRGRGRARGPRRARRAGGRA